MRRRLWRVFEAGEGCLLVIDMGVRTIALVIRVLYGDDRRVAHVN